MRARVALLTAVIALVGGCAEERPALDADGSPSVSTPGLPTVTVSGDRPVVEVPAGDPPRELVIDDLIVGDGPPAAAGDTVIVHYVGVAYSTGEEFDASWNTGQPFPVVLGTGGVIDGWEQGIPGMRAGGRRQLIIPPELAYGEEGYPGVIGPNETLIFVIDLIDVQ